jgi:hypothetical protein
MCIHSFFDFVIPTNSQTYFLFKDFITIVAVFITMPIIMIMHNENMSKYVAQHLQENFYSYILINIPNLCKKMFGKKKVKKFNSILPIPYTENRKNLQKMIHMMDV